MTRPPTRHWKNGAAPPVRLSDDVVELLTQAGPLEPEFIRVRLCVASEARMQAALLVATEEGRIERVNGGYRGDSFRVKGDVRVPGAGDIHLQNKWKQKGLRWPFA
jgi:hypothetical protein